VNVLPDEIISNKVFREEAAECYRLVEHILNKMETIKPINDEDAGVCIPVPKYLVAFIKEYHAFACEDNDSNLKNSLVSSIQGKFLAIDGPLVDPDKL
jgi:hypothetical protein